MDDKITIRRDVSTSPFDDGKFKEKMTHEQRCFVLCLHIRGEPWRLIAAYYNTHYRTVQMIKTGPRYKAVRTEFNKLGQDDFVAKYETESELAAFAAFKKEQAPELFADRQHADPDKPGWSPRQNATGSKGQHKRTSVIDGSEVFFDVEWRDANDNKRPGWYLFHKNGEDGPYGTSTIAFDAARELWNPITTAKANEPADAETQTAQQLFEAAKAARTAMELNPNSETVEKFVIAAFAVYWFVDKSEGLPELPAHELLPRIDWKGFDPAPFEVHVNNHLVKDYKK